MNQQKQFIIAGVMSGTSLDGLDVAFCKFRKENEKYSGLILAAETIDYNDEMKAKLGSAHLLNAVDFCKFHNDFGHYIGLQIIKLIEKFNIHPNYIASHGHTVIHQPEIKLTVQAGNGAVIAATTAIDTVCDFRSADVALGGQGAPLVPFGDVNLFSQFDAALNLGGFSNITLMKVPEIQAFDICPVNIVLNSLAQQAGEEFDEAGQMAESGAINAELFSELEAIELYHSDHRHSLSREWVEQHIHPILHRWSISTNDYLRTFTEHAAKRIAQVLNDYQTENCLVTGGGAYNSFLIDCIRKQTSAHIIVPDNQMVAFKEAFVFAFLGLRRIQGEVNVISSITGASRDSSSGTIWKA